jgi:hypothetical protein
MRSDTRRSGGTHADEISLVDAIWLGVLTLVVVPLMGMVAALGALDLTRSFQAHAATAMVLPAALMALIARRFAVSGGVVLRLALMAALFAVVLLDLGWSGLPG